MKKHLALALAGALLLSGCQLLPPEAEEPAITVAAPVVTQREITTVQSGSIDVRVSLAVSFGAEQQEARYFTTGGRLKQVHVRVGQPVAAGQLLAELEAGTLPYDLAQTELDLQKARLSLAALQAKKGFVDAPSPTELQLKELDLQKLELQLKQKQDALAATRMYAPYAGQVLSLSAATGDQVDAYKEVLVLAAAGPVVARATVDDATAARLRVGQRAEIYPADGDPTPVPGTVVVAPLLGSTAADKVVVIRPDQSGTRLQPGRNSKAEVVVESRSDVLLVPVSAVRSFGGRKFVTVSEGDTRREAAIQTGLENETQVEVTAGLKAGDRVVSR